MPHEEILGALVFDFFGLLQPLLPASEMLVNELENPSSTFFEDKEFLKALTDVMLRNSASAMDMLSIVRAELNRRKGYPSYYD